MVIESGDTVWWKWDLPTMIDIQLFDYHLLNKKTIPDECKETGKCLAVNENKGVMAQKFALAGIYYLEAFNGENTSIITVVVCPKRYSHKVTIDDSFADPSKLHVFPEDRVWFVWDETRWPQNVLQVDHQNLNVTDGFYSGPLKASPGTFMNQFEDLGVYYYRSDSKINQILGAIIVVPEAKVFHIQVFLTIKLKSQY